jgi:hypothetical protein
VDSIVFIISLGKCGLRGAAKLLKRSPRLNGRLVSQQSERPDVVVVVSPKGQFAASMILQLTRTGNAPSPD